jgi:hypothetical protein
LDSSFADQCKVSVDAPRVEIVIEASHQKRDVGIRGQNLLFAAASGGAPGELCAARVEAVKQRQSGSDHPGVGVVARHGRFPGVQHGTADEGLEFEAGMKQMSALALGGRYARNEC